MTIITHANFLSLVACAHKYLPFKSHTKNCEEVMAWWTCRVLQRTLQRSGRRRLSDYCVGDKIHGYSVDQVQKLPELSATAVKLSHGGSGAQHLHVAKDDVNNSFGVGFGTIPEDSTGVAHILEHTTLCGSNKYPVRDPFFKMLNRSLSTFMNAFTSSDWTMYPFSTQNLKDFNNLMSIYLDCTFFPLLKASDFKQEGWRLEHSEVANKDSPITFKGVVYNEMKGVYANSEYLYCEAMQNFLLPSTTYAFSSGGKPINILDLSIEKLKEFRSHFYHPSNAKFFTYGSFPLDSHLQMINNDVLSKFEKKPSFSHYETKTLPWEEPRSHHIQCAPDPSFPDQNKTTTFSMTYLLSPITERYECFLLAVLCHMLSEGPTTFFYKALLDSNLGYKFSPGTGYQTDTLQSFFSVGLQGIDSADVPKIESTIQSTFEKAYTEGFSQESIASVIHQMELGLKFQEKNLGLKLAVEVVSPWVHGADPVDFLVGNELINRFKSEVSNDFLREMVYKFFVTNRHILKLTMSPSPDFVDTQNKIEEAKLNSMVTKLSDEEKQCLLEEGVALKAEQSQLQDISVLPTVQLEDISRKGPETAIDTVSKTANIYCHNEPTNGLVYVNLSINFSSLPDHLKKYVPFFSYVVTRMGAGDYNYTELSQQFDLHTGKMSVAPHILPHHSSSDGYFEELLCSSYSTILNAPKMLSLWKDVLLRPDFDNEQLLLHLLKDYSTTLAQNVTFSGHRYSTKLSSSTLTSAAHIQEELFGISQIKFLHDLATTGDAQKLKSVLRSIAENIDGKNMRAFWTSDLDHNETMSEVVQDFMQGMGHVPLERDYVSSNPSFSSDTGRKVFVVLPSSVNYVSQSFLTVPYSHPDSPKLHLLAKLLNSKYLHKNIREIGGAYGSAAVQSDGVFSFASYRDPNVHDTFSVYDGARKWLLEDNFFQQDIDESKFRIFSEIDSPIYLQDKGMRWFLSRRNDDQMQLFRDHLLAVSQKDLLEVCEKYFSSNRNSSVIGPSQPLDESWTILEF